ncbi:uncharacterized protein [Triticum aestivum]|uniref:uncharacterized protein n=1 Tax=Triticum aestivum TaxID=4565 RepID=UPI001D008B6E|nr:uncharacterized protein LOC123146989 [Triticum aestivum]
MASVFHRSLLDLHQRGSDPRRECARAHQWVAKEEEAKYKAAKDAYELARRKLANFNGPLSHLNRQARDPAAEQPHLRAAALNAAQEEHDRLFTDEKLAKREMESSLLPDFLRVCNSRFLLLQADRVALCSRSA